MRKLFIQTVYIPRENIFFVEEWMSYHKKLGVDAFYMYDNTGSNYMDAVGNLMINGKNKQGINVKEKTAHLSDQEIRLIEDKIFKKYNATRIEWKPKDSDGNITYGQIEALYSFKNIVKKGYCAFIDIDEFIVLRHHKSIKKYIKDTIGENSGIKIYQKRYLNRWYNPSSVLSINATFSINTDKWAPKIIADIEKIPPVADENTNIHFFMHDVYFDKYGCWFNHYNHEINNHMWLIHNRQELDPEWKPFDFRELELLFMENKVNLEKKRAFNFNNKIEQVKYFMKRLLIKLFKIIK